MPAAARENYGEEKELTTKGAKARGEAAPRRFEVNRARKDAAVPGQRAALIYGPRKSKTSVNAG